MAITITGNGYSYSAPPTMGLRSFEDGIEIPAQAIQGRDGFKVNKKNTRIASVSLSLAGLLAGTDASDLGSKFKTFSEVLHSQPEPLILSTGTRTIRVRLQNLSIERIPSGGKKLGIAVTFISEDGYWQDSVPTENYLGSFSGYPKPALKSVTVSGAYKTYPTIRWTADATIQDPTVTWYGQNLIKNSSFSMGLTTNWTLASLARLEKYSSKWVARVASGNTFKQSNIPCNASTGYYFSAYAARTAASTARLTIEWYNSSDVLLSTDTITYAATTTLTRFSSAKTSPASAVYFNLTLDSTSAIYVYITDIQAEESASLSEFMPSQDVTFAISGNTQFVVGDVLEIDCERKTVRHWDSGAPQWYNKIDVSNAQFFYLNPGKNLLAFSNELNANAQIFERHTERYLGY